MLSTYISFHLHLEEFQNNFRTGENDNMYDKLIRDIKIVLAEWDGYSTFQLSGVTGLTLIDISIIDTYAKMYQRCGRMGTLVNTATSIREVLTTYKKKYLESSGVNNEKKM